MQMEGEGEGSCSAKSLKFMNAFPTNKVKNQIRTEEKIGKVFTTAVDLVATSSAIFLDKIVQESIKIAQKNPGNEIGHALMGNAAPSVKNEVETSNQKTVEHNTSTSSENTSSGETQSPVQYILLTKESIQRVIQSNQTYDFLQASIPENMDGISVPKYGSIYRSRSRAKKRNSGTTQSSGMKKRVKTHEDKTTMNESSEIKMYSSTEPFSDKKSGGKMTKKEIKTLGEGLDLEKLQTADEYFDEISEDDEEYD